MRNVTVVLDDDTALWVRVEAAKHDTSVSKFVGGMLQHERRRNESYEVARAAYTARGSQGLCAHGEAYPSRDEMHER